MGIIWSTRTHTSQFRVFPRLFRIDEKIFTLLSGLLHTISAYKILQATRKVIDLETFFNFEN